MSKEVEGAAGGERLGFSLGLGLESDRGTSGESRLKVCWVRFLIVSFYAVTRHSMPRATRVLLLAPLFLRLAGLRAAVSQRAMVGYAVPGFTYEHVDAECISFDRNGTGGNNARRFLFWQILGIGKDAHRAEKPLTWREVIELWRTSEAFRDVFLESLNAEWCDMCEDYLWECAPVSSNWLDTTYEHVVQDRGAACGGARDGPEVFREHFQAARANGSEVAVFSNLGGDAVLVAPVPNARGLQMDAGACVRDFAKGAPRRVKHDVLRALGEAVHEGVSDAPLWISTNGAGVAWLHIRLDSRPKYYAYRPYTKLRNGRYDAAAREYS